MPCEITSNKMVRKVDEVMAHRGVKTFGADPSRSGAIKTFPHHALSPSDILNNAYPARDK